MDEFLNEISALVSRGGSRAKKAKYIAAMVKARGGYRWVGIYDVGSEEVSIIAWSGPGAPAYPTFPVTQGLTAAAIDTKKPVLVNDVTVDDRYLTAFGSTRSEVIIPVLDGNTGSVLGTIDVESEEPNAFSEEDQKTLEACAIAVSPLWTK
jgi:putative methionine-R-sulfoxide reductase with GAF domain